MAERGNVAMNLMTSIVDKVTIKPFPDELFETVTHEGLRLLAFDDGWRGFRLQRIVVSNDSLDISLRQFSPLHTYRYLSTNFINGSNCKPQLIVKYNYLVNMLIDLKFYPDKHILIYDLGGVVLSSLNQFTTKFRL